MWENDLFLSKKYFLIRIGEKKTFIIASNAIIKYCQSLNTVNYFRSTTPFGEILLLDPYIGERSFMNVFCEMQPAAVLYEPMNSIVEFPYIYSQDYTIFSYDELFFLCVRARARACACVCVCVCQNKQLYLPIWQTLTSKKFFSSYEIVMKKIPVQK